MITTRKHRNDILSDYTLADIIANGREIQQLARDCNDLDDLLREARIYICQRTTPTPAEAAHGGIVDRINALLGAKGGGE